MLDFIIPSILTGICLYAVCLRLELFPVFLEGAQKGLKTALSILPTLVGLLTAVYMLRASGAIDWIAAILAPLLRL